MKRILLASGQSITRYGLKSILEMAIRPASFGEAVTGQQTTALLRLETWDLLVIDISMPGGIGFESLPKAHALAPTVPILVLGSAPETHLDLRAIRAGASGYLNIRTMPARLVSAARALLAGGNFISPQLRTRLAEEAKHRPGKTGLGSLSVREMQVFQMTVLGHSLKEIATELELSAKTISTFRHRIFEKFGVKTDIQLLRRSREDEDQHEI